MFANEHSSDNIVGINLFGDDDDESTNSPRRNVESYGDNRMTLSELDVSDIPSTPPMTPGPSQESETPILNNDPYTSTFEPYNTP